MEEENSTSSGWTCRCGRTKNDDEFCISCGRSRAEGEGENGDAEAASNASLPNASLLMPIPSSEPPEPPHIKINANSHKSSRSYKQAFSPFKQLTFARSVKEFWPIFLIIAICLVIVGVMFSGPNHTPAQKTTTTTTQKASPAQSSASTKSVRKMKSDLSLGGLDLDMTVDEVHKALGKETSAKKQGKFDFIYYPDLQVGTYQNVVRALVSDGPSVETKRGIHEGSTLADIRKAYGTDCQAMDYDDLTLYEYSFKSMKGHDGLLRFAVKKSDNTVSYISVRIPEDEKATDDTSKTRENDAKLALTVLDGYYQGITNGHERKAYQLLTSSRQKKMGTFEQFKKGFETTLSHRVDQLQVDSASPGVIKVSYLLTARDRTDNFGGVKYRVFQCTATIVKDTDAWRIDDMTAEKVSEGAGY